VIGLIKIPFVILIGAWAIWLYTSFSGHADHVEEDTGALDSISAAGGRSLMAEAHH